MTVQAITGLQSDVTNLRRGACPTLGRPMRTGDGLLARLRPEDCRLTLAQLRAVAHAAEAFGNGIVEVTARGSLQIRGLNPETVGPLEQAVFDADITPATGLMVEVPPLAGLDPAELIDPRPIAEEIRRMAAEHKPLLVLAPKLAVVVDGSGRFHLGEVLADIRLTAIDAERFLLAVGGTNRSARKVAVVETKGAAPAVLQVLEAIAAIGPAARGRDVELEALSDLYDPASSGIAVRSEVQSFLGVQTLTSSPPSVLPDIAPPRGEIRRKPAHRLKRALVAERSTVDEGGIVPHRISPLEGEMPGRAEGGKPLPETCTLGLALPYRQARAVDLIKFLDEIEILGLSDIHLAPGHGMILTGLHHAEAAEAEDAARRHGFWTSPREPRANISLCAGTSGCASAHYDTRAVAEEIGRRAPALLDGSITLHLSGCPKGCAHPAPASVTIIGAPSGYGLVVNGVASEAPALYIAAKDLGIAFERLASRVAAAKETGETARDGLARLGPADIAAALTLDKQ